MESIWQEVSLPHFDQLKGDINTEVLIIGGGLVGLLCATLLKEAGIANVVAEASTICSGITKNTTAKITSQHGLIYDKMLRRFGTEKAALYLHTNEAAIARYREMCSNIDCDFVESDSFVYSINDRTKLEKEMRALERLGYPADIVEKLPVPFHTLGAVHFPHQAQFHPLKFAGAIAKKLHIYEHTMVRKLVGNTAFTDTGTITAKKIIVATHYPIINRCGLYFMKLYQKRSYVYVLENAGKLNGMYVDEASRGFSLRSYGNLLLLGGGSHRTGKRSGAFAELTSFTRRHYPDAKLLYRYATQDCISLDSIPYIGPYATTTPDWYVASGFNKWGMTSSMVAAMLLTDEIYGKQNPARNVYLPSRSILRPQLAANLLESTLHLLLPVKRRCPHMGCALSYNAVEHTYDCPCHGSRFAEDGSLIDNPAQRGLNIRS